MQAYKESPKCGASRREGSKLWVSVLASWLLLCQEGYGRIQESASHASEHALAWEILAEEAGLFLLVQVRSDS